MARRKLLINPRFQLKMLMYLFFFILVVFVFQFSLGMYFFAELIDLGKNSNLPDGHIYFEFIKNQANGFYMLMATGMAIITFVSLLWGLYESNKIAGAMFQLTRTIRAIIAKDEVQEIKLRKNDYFQEVIASVNELIAKFINKRVE